MEYRNGCASSRFSGCGGGAGDTKAEYVDAPDVGAPEGGGEGGGWDRTGAWCLVRIHSGPKCIVVEVICSFHRGRFTRLYVRGNCVDFRKFFGLAQAEFTRGKYSTTAS